MNEEQASAWDAYLGAEAMGDRRGAMRILDAFIAALERAGAGSERWALELSRRIVDQGADIPMRLPLFRRVVGPALAQAASSGEAEAARWLAHFDMQLAHAPEVRDSLPPELRGVPQLLEHAVRQRPDDKRAQRAFLDWAEGYLDYTLHELPAGVLWGADAATPEQCDELLELSTFTRQVAKAANREGELKQLLKDCTLHYTAYRRYRVHPCGAKTYEEFLHAQGLV